MTAPPRPRGSVPLLAACIGAALLLVFLVVAYIVPPTHPTTTAIPPLANEPVGSHHFTAAPNTTVVPAGTTWLVPGSSFTDVVMQFTLPADLGGGFYSTAPVVVYVLSSAAFLEFEMNHSTQRYYWSEPNVLSGSLTLSISAGTWYLVFANPASETPLTVVVTSDILATYPLGASSWGSTA